MLMNTALQANRECHSTIIAACHMYSVQESCNLLIVCWCWTCSVNCLLLVI